MGLGSDLGWGIISARGQGLDSHTGPLGDGVETEPDRTHRSAPLAPVGVSGEDCANVRGDGEDAQTSAKTRGEHSAGITGAGGKKTTRGRPTRKMGGHGVAEKTVSSCLVYLQGNCFFILPAEGNMFFDFYAATLA